MTKAIQTPVKANKARTLTHIIAADGRVIASVEHQYAEQIVEALNRVS